MKEHAPSQFINQTIAINYLANKFLRSNPLNKDLKSPIMDITEKEIQDLLKNLNKYEVKYLLVGGFATSYHGYPRSTHDLDLWIKNNPENMKRLSQALKSINVPGSELIENMQLVAGFSTLRFGEKGFELDLMHALKKFKETDFDACYKKASHGKYDGIPISVINYDDLIEEKKFVNRAKDQDDIENLEKIRKQNK